VPNKLQIEHVLITLMVYQVGPMWWRLNRRWGKGFAEAVKDHLPMQLWGRLISSVLGFFRCRLGVRYVQCTLLPIEGVTFWPEIRSNAWWVPTDGTGTGCTIAGILLSRQRPAT
jgi:hypothetical protein